MPDNHSSVNSGNPPDATAQATGSPIRAVPQCDPTAIREFIETLHERAEPFRGKGELVVASFGQNPDTGKNLTPIIKHYEIGDGDGMAADIVAMQGTPHRNVYVPLVVMRSDLPPGLKGGEADIVAVLGLVADFDDADASRWRDRMPLPPDYLLETSPGRFHAGILFERPLSLAEAKELALALAGATGCDTCAKDLSHVWRSPGTQNWPNQQKALDGRSRTPWLVQAVIPPGPFCTDPNALKIALDAVMRAKAPIATAPTQTPAEAADRVAAMIAELQAGNVLAVTDRASLPPELATKLDIVINTDPVFAGRYLQGQDDPKWPPGDRSRRDQGLAARLKAKGFSAIETAMVLRSFEHGGATDTKHGGDYGQIRYLARCLVNSFDPATPNAKSEPNQWDIAFAKLDAAGVEVFKSLDGRPHISVRGRNYRLPSDAARGELFRILRGQNRTDAPRRKLIDDIVDALTGEALACGPTRPTFSRVFAVSDGQGARAYLGMGDDAGTILVLDDAGYRPVGATSVPARLVNTSGCLPIPLPLSDGQARGILDRLREHLNLPPRGVAPGDLDAEHDPGIQADAAILAVLSAWFFPVGPVPHLALAGPAGTGKSTVARRLTSVVDPNSAGVRSMPASNADLLVQLANAHVLALDNVSRITPETSDTLCLASTGGAHNKRRLYSDDDLAPLHLKAGVILTAVADVVSRDDLADRVLVLPLAPILSRRTERDGDAAWSRDYPAIMDALLRAIAAGLARLPQVQATTQPDALVRLADMAMMAEAVARGLGWPDGFMLTVLRAMRADSRRDTLASDPFYQRLRTLLTAAKGTWSGTPADLLHAICTAGGSAWTGPTAPARPIAVTNMLARLAAALIAEGWQITKGMVGRGKARTRNIQITAPTVAGDTHQSRAENNAPDFPF